MRGRLSSLIILIICLSLCLVLAVTGQNAQPATVSTGTPVQPRAGSMELELVGQIGGPTYGVAVQGSYAYIGVGPRLVILDVLADPHSPVVVGQTDVMSAVVQGVAVSGNYAYVTIGSAGLSVVDISSPIAPTIVGTCGDVGTARKVVIVGDHAYVTSWDVGLSVVAVSAPDSPTLVGVCDSPIRAEGVIVAGDYAYIADNSDRGLLVIDVSNPSLPEEIGSCAILGDARDVSMVGDYAYVVGYDALLHIVDVSTPSTPWRVWHYDWGWQRPELAVAARDNHVYVAAGDEGFSIIDVSVPREPVEVGLCETPDDAYALVLLGDFAYVAAGVDGLRILDVWNTESPVEVGFWSTLANPHGVTVAGNYAYVADSNEGLCVYDISSPELPTRMGSLSRSWIEDVAVAGSHVYIVGGGSLSVIDVSTLTAPFEVGSCGSCSGQSITIADNYAFIASDYYGLTIVDLAIPESPQIVSSFRTPGLSQWGAPSDVQVAQGYAYIADGPSGLRILNVSTPESPSNVGSCYVLPTRFGSLALAGHYAYVSAYEEGLRVLDVSDAGNPREVASCETPGRVDDVEVAGNYAFVLDSEVGLCVIDVSSPLSPSGVVASYNTPGWLNDLAVVGNYIYLADGIGGLVVLRSNIEFAPTPTFTPIGAPTSTPTPTRTPQQPAPTVEMELVGQSYEPSRYLAVQEEYAYVTDRELGLRVIDVSSPEAPVTLGSYECRDVDLAVAGPYAYLATGGLRVLDISDPANPMEVGYCAVTDGGYTVSVNHVAVAGEYACVIASCAYMPSFIDVSNPESPVMVTTPIWSRSYYSHGVAMTEDRAYVTGVHWNEGSLGVYTVTGQYGGGGCGTLGEALDVAVAGDFAYVADGTSGLAVIDISMPDRSVVVGLCDTLGPAYHAAVAGSYVYVTAGDSGLRVIDVSRPGSPIEVGSYHTPGNPLDVAVDDHYVYVACGDEGLIILQNNTAAAATPTPTATLESYWFNGRVYDDDTGLGIEGVTIKLYQWVDLEWTEIISRTTSDTGLYGLWAEGLPGKYAVVEVNPEGYVSTRAWVHQGLNGTIIDPDRVEFDNPPNGLVGMTNFYDVVAPPTETPTVTPTMTLGPFATPTATNTLTLTPTLTCTPTATPEVYRIPLPLVFKG